MIALDIILGVLAVVVLVPLAVLIVEVLFALPPGRKTLPPTGPRPACAVLMPAHNEEAGIGTTLAGIGPALQPGDRLVVVADNCTDRTAEVARNAGATVYERTDAERRGKGYALDFGMSRLAESPPEVVVLIDADCRLSEGTMDRLVRVCAATNRPIQAVYLMDCPPEAGPRGQLSAFAFQFKNQVRPLGLARLGLPCLLMGTGMAFPWAQLRGAALASGNIVEDMQLGIDLAVAGHVPRLCPEAGVFGELPVGGKVAAKQRTRWEHGHMQTLLTQVPRLLRAGLTKGRPALLGLALEVGVPPLSMLFLLWAAALTAAVVGWQVGASPVPALALAIGGVLAPLAVFAAWLRYGRERLPFRSLLAAPFYVLGKVPIYLKFVAAREKAWVRTERKPGTPDGGASGAGKE